MLYRISIFFKDKQIESKSNSNNESVINELNNQLSELKNANGQLREHDSEQVIIEYKSDLLCIIRIIKKSSS